MVSSTKSTPTPETDPKRSEPVGRTSTKSPKPTWEVDGRFFELRQIGDYGIWAQQRLNRDGREFYQLWTSEEELTEDQGKRLKFLLDRMFEGDEKVAPLLDAPKTVLRRLNDGDRADVVLSFTLAPLRKVMVATAQQQTEEQKDQEARDSESISTS